MLKRIWKGFEEIGGEIVDGMKLGFGCDTPGRKIRSGGKGRGVARGKGYGPIGVPNTKGLGLGLGRGRGRGRGMGPGPGNFTNLGF